MEGVTTCWNKYARCCALALRLDGQYFSKTLEDMDLCTLRLLHYPPCANLSDHKKTEQDLSSNSNQVPDSKCAIQVGEHADFGIFTFFFIQDIADDSSLGLQIKHPSSDGTASNW